MSEIKKCLCCGNSFSRRGNESTPQFDARRGCSNRCAALLHGKGKGKAEPKPAAEIGRATCPLCQAKFAATADQRYRIRNNISIVFCSSTCSKKGIALSRAFNAQKAEMESVKTSDLVKDLNAVLFSWMRIT
ncbi:MAG: hypothetical protein Q8O37_06675 [Sulfuricellaceae bacterium]|nr:hypothetical protein [Sulfuricellaceae bacterium]